MPNFEFGTSEYTLAVAVTPLAVYLLVLGVMQMVRRPWLVNGTRDLITLGFALSGFAMVGPMQLFFPRFAYAAIGPRVWIALLILYWLLLVLIALSMRPRIVAYRLNALALKELIQQTLGELNVDQEWMDHSFRSEQLGVQASIERSGWGVVSQIAAVSRYQSLKGWIALEQSLARNMREMPGTRTSYAVISVLLGLAMLVFSATIFLFDPTQTADFAKELLRI